MMKRSILNITYWDRKSTCIREKTKVKDMIEHVRTQKWTRPGNVSIEYEITDGHRVSSPENVADWNDLEIVRRDDGETN